MSDITNDESIYERCRTWDMGLSLQRTAPRVIRVVKANETPAAKMQRLMDAAFRKYAQEFPAEALEIVRQEVLDKRK